MKILKAIAGLFLAYVLVLGVYAAWSLAAAKFETVANLESRLSALLVGFVLGAETDRVTFDLILNGVPVPRDPRVSERVPQSLDEFDVIVFLLNGFETAIQSDFMRSAGIKVADIASMDSSHTKRTTTVSLHYRIHPLPFYLQRRNFVFADLGYLEQNFEVSCVSTILYDLALGGGYYDQEPACKTS
ncbi:hypothetical protein [uncultured Tateyamaria sp.]|uniref:hypothetical protein n=1 Tax=uncultured Tateyamaria sp. TaxID=455651 RepID=UPI0026093A6F|nr:hypothetical protein [uncultured Tateyamaria sp.]